ncbi:ComF family protein [Ramlibacter sp. G-1-2-2]|uniref:ComF family protein n=1 Tax=Ramlibacter agri TaxID=2728837 RepID=A0A848GYA0_9BURK|nr:phosphoribosyltransferase family protein [Ramlibacter agri]NML43137.1 ComF family protein [Ramlibacter agri]
MRTAWLQKVAKAAPSRCAVCGAWPAHALCAACLERFARPRLRCRRCALPVPEGIVTCGACLHASPPLDACYAAVSYGYPWSSLVARFKFHGEPGWARSLSGLMRSVPGVAQELDAADLVLPMPLATTRLAERGFNQAVQLAREIASGKTETRLLLRLRDTAAQASLDRSAREGNVKGAFGVDPLRVHELKGKSALLVDDVMTSGASLHAAAVAVRAAGAARVSALVLARTDPP